MAVAIVQISNRLRNILAELDRRELHLAAAHVAKALEIVELSEGSRSPFGKPNSISRDDEDSKILN